LLFTSSSCSIFQRTTENSSDQSSRVASRASEKNSSAQQAQENALQTELFIKEGEITKLQERVQSLEKELSALRPGESIPSEPPLGLQPAVTLVKNDPLFGYRVDPGFKLLDEGTTLLSAGQIPEAILSLSRMIDGNPKHPLKSHAQYSLARAYLNQKDLESARDILEKLSVDEPGSPVQSFVLRDLLGIYRAQNNPAKLQEVKTILSKNYLNSPASEGIDSVSEALMSDTLPAIYPSPEDQP